jgi:hypothetical protein
LQHISAALNDVAYYLQEVLCPGTVPPAQIDDLPGDAGARDAHTRNIIEEWRSRDPLVFGALTSYFPIPGKYKFPHDCGTFMVTPDQVVDVKPTGCQQSYQGKNIFINRPLVTVSYPWHKTVGFCGKLSTVGF